jgi:serine/threonine-protein kinase
MPFRAPTPVEVEELHLHASPPRASALVPVSRDVDAVLLRCMAKEPGARFATALEVLGEMRRAVSPRASARPASGSARGVALYVQVRPASADAADDALDELEALTDQARRAFESIGLTLAIDVGQVLLGVALLPDDPAEELALRRRVVDGALSLTATPHDQARVQLSATAHVAPVLTRLQEGAPRPVGGELFCVGEWAAGGAGEGVTASAAVLRGFELLATVEPIGGHADLRRVTRRSVISS